MVVVVVVGLLLRTEERKLRRSQFGTFSLRIIERPPGPSWSITAFFLSSLSVSYPQLTLTVLNASLAP